MLNVHWEWNYGTFRPIWAWVTYIECRLLASCFLYYLFEISQIPFLSEPIRCIKPLSCNFLIILAIVALDNFVTCISVWYVIALSFCIKSNTHASDLLIFTVSFTVSFTFGHPLGITMNTSHSNCCNKIFSFFLFLSADILKNIFWKYLVIFFFICIFAKYIMSYI